MRGPGLKVAALFVLAAGTARAEPRPCARDSDCPAGQTCPMETCVGPSSQPVTEARSAGPSSQPVVEAPRVPPPRFTLGVRGVLLAPYAGTLEATVRPTSRVDVGLFGSVLPGSPGVVGAVGGEITLDASRTHSSSFCLDLSAMVARRGELLDSSERAWFASLALDPLCLDGWGRHWEVQVGLGVGYGYLTKAPDYPAGSGFLPDFQLALRYGFDGGAPLR